MTPPVPDLPSAASRALCSLSELEDGRSRGFDPAGDGRDTMFVVRRADRVYAYRNACPHYDAARMAWKKDEFLNGDRSRIMCAGHGALFRIEDGLCEIGPCLGQSLVPIALDICGDDVRLRDVYPPQRRR